MLRNTEIKAPSEASDNRLQRVPPKSGAKALFGHRPLMLVTVLGVALTGVVFLLAAQREERRDRLRFLSHARDFAERVQVNFSLPVEFLRSVPPFMAASGGVDRDGFRRFVEGALDRHGSVYAFEWLPRVEPDARELFEAQARADGLPQFKIRAAEGNWDQEDFGQRVSFPIFFMEPSDPTLLGLDTSFDPSRGQFFEEVCSGNRLRSTHRVRLVEDPIEVFSVVAMAPVRIPPKDVSAAKCDGLAALLLRVKPVIEASLGTGTLEQYRVALWDNDGAPGQKLLYKNFPGELDTLGGAGGFRTKETLTFANRAWTLDIAPARGSAHRMHGAPWWILVVGVGMSVLAGYGVNSATSIAGLQKEVEAALELGQYRLGEKLGEGGMGSVYEAEHQMLARPAAIKLIRNGAADSIGSDGEPSGRSINRFEKEAQATASLESPHTVSIYDFGTTDSGTFYYVMERLKGIDLKSLVQRTGPMSADRAIHLLGQICESLHEAHNKGMVHRDIKPANVFVSKVASRFDFVKVLDFGLVKSQESDVTITQEGTILGAPAFMAPETIRGDEVDHRADIYSLGCVAYWMLTGQLVFVAENTAGIMMKHLSEVPPPPSTQTERKIPADLEAVVMQCLKKDPADRPTDIAQVHWLLRRCQDATSWRRMMARNWWLAHLPDLI